MCKTKWLWAIVIVASSLGAQEILKTNLQGTGLQPFDAGEPIVRFSTSGPDASGYVYLTAISQSGTEYTFFRSKWEGVAVQGFSPSSSEEYVTGFTTSTPDASGYVTLSAVTNLGNTYDILKSKWTGIAFQDYTAPQDYAISGFSVSNNGTDIILSCLTSYVSIKEKQDNLPHTFRVLSVYPNPTTDNLVVRYAVPHTSTGKIELYDISGKRVLKLFDGVMERGNHTSIFHLKKSGEKLKSGIYFIKIEYSDKTMIKKISVIN